MFLERLFEALFEARKTGPSAHAPLISSETVETVADVPLAGLSFRLCQINPMAKAATVIGMVMTISGGPRIEPSARTCSVATITASPQTPRPILHTTR